MILPTVEGRPVLLPSHTDKELGQPVKHYHVDPRFHKGREVLIFEDIGQEVIWTEYPDKTNTPTIEFGIGMYLQLLSIYEGKYLNGTKCPHKEIEVFHEGQCQGHGLRFDAHGQVVGRIADCFLRIQGTSSVSVRGNFQVVAITDQIVQAKAVELVYEGQVLAWSRIGPVGAIKGEHLKFSFAVGQGKVVDCSVTESCVPNGLVSCGHPDTIRRTDRIALRTLSEPQGDDADGSDTPPD